MRLKRLLASTVAAPLLLLTFGVSAQAFECPKHIEAAQAVIDKVAGDMKGEMSKQMDKGDMALVHALLDDAKTWLSSATHNHEKPNGLYDHARSIAKADSALGYATAADILHFKMMAK